MLLLRILVYAVDKFKISQTDGVIQTWWRLKTSSHDSEAVKRLVHFVCERAFGERLFSPRYLTRGAQEIRNLISCKAENAVLIRQKRIL